MVSDSNNYNKKTSVVNNIILVIFFFVYIYSVRFEFIPVNTALIASIFGAVIMFFLVMTRKIEISFSPNFLLVTLMYILLFAWILYRTLSSDFLDTSFAHIGSKIFFQSIPNAIFGVYLIKKNHNSLSGLISTIQLAIFLQSIFIILTFVSIDFRVFSNDIIPVAGNIPATSVYRVRGITNSTGAALSTIQSLGLLFTIHALTDKSISTRKQIFYLISIPILIISIALTGNSGFLMIGFIILYFMGIRTKKKGFSVKAIANIIKVLIIIGIVFSSFYLLYMGFGVNKMPWGEDALQRVVRSVTEEFSYSDDSILPHTVSVLLKSHYHLPDDAKTFIFGNPLTWSYERVKSDVGYIRNIYGIGVIGSILAYSAFIVLLSATRKRANGKNDKTLITILMLWLLFMEMKEPFVLQPYYVFVYFSLFSYYHVHFKRKGQKSNELL